MTTRSVALPERARSFDVKLAAYALAGGAFLFTAATPAQAALIVVNPDPKPSLLIPTAGGANTLSLDMDNDGIIDFAFLLGSFDYGDGYANDFVNVAGTDGAYITGVYPDCGCDPEATNFANINDALASNPNLTKAKLLARYTYGGVPYFYGTWPNGLNLSGILGVTFLLGGTTLTNGFIDVSVEIGSAGVTINQWGYNAPDPGGVPEPSTMALFALGAAGVAALRRRKAQ